MVSDLSSTNRKFTVDMVSPRDEMLIIKSISNPMILVLPSPASYPGKTYWIKNRSSSDEVYISGGTLQTTSSTSGNIIRYNSNASCNDGVTVTSSGGNTAYY